MQIQYLTSKDYKIWDEFCEKHKYAIFMHTSYAMEYYIDSSFNIKSKQNSFFVYNNNNLVACVPLFVEEINEKKYISYGGTALPNPLILESLSSKNKKKVFNFIFEKIDEIANKENCARIEMTITHLSSEYINRIDNYNYLLKNKNYLDISTYTCLIDLKVSEKEII